MVISHPVLQVIPIDNDGQLHEAFNMRIDELNVLDMRFLEGTLKPTLVVLYQDSKEARHIKTYEVNLKEKAGSSQIYWCLIGKSSSSCCCAGTNCNRCAAAGCDAACPMLSTAMQPQSALHWEECSCSRRHMQSTFWELH